jgi:putative hemolysin
MTSDSGGLQTERSMAPALLPMPDFSYASDEVGRMSQYVIRAIEKLTGQPLIRRLYQRYRSLQRPPELFWDDAIAALRLDLRMSQRPERVLSPHGPLVIIANHPFGVVDGIILCWIASRVRSDFMIMTHSVLYRAPEVRPHVLPIDFSGTREALQTNIRSRAEARKQLERGGVLIVFPAAGLPKPGHSMVRRRSSNGRASPRGSSCAPAPTCCPYSSLGRTAAYIRLRQSCIKP